MGLSSAAIYVWFVSAARIPVCWSVTQTASCTVDLGCDTLGRWR